MRRLLGGLSVVVLIALLGFAAPCAVPWSPPSVADVEAAVDGLGFDAFIDVSYHQYLLRFPEAITGYGLSEEFGIRNDSLESYDYAYMQETAAIERLILDRLRTYDRQSLDDAQRMTFDVALWYWDDVVRGQAFSDYNYLVHYMNIRSAHGLMELTLTEDHAFETEDDVVDYITRLGKVGETLDEIIAEVDRRSALGILTPRVPLEWAYGDIRNMAQTYVRRHPFYQTLESKGAEIEGLTSEALETYLDQARSVIDTSVKPAYRRLLTAVERWIGEAPEALSLSQFDGGLAAYEHLLRHHTQTELTPDEIHQLGLQDVERIKAEILFEASLLGYDGADDMSAIFDWVRAQTGQVAGDEAVAYAEELIAKATAIVLDTGALSQLPEASVGARGVPSGGFYSSAPLDGSRPGEYFVTTSGSDVFAQPTIAYHETVPGHHVQLSLASELDMPLFRRTAWFTGYGEGWALYSEQLMYEIGGYDDDPYGNLGRLQYELLRAARLVTDTGIHAYGWSREEAMDYVGPTMGVSNGSAEYRVLRYTVIPGQATAYKVGMIELLRLRTLAKESLGDAFDLASFHDIVLGNGAVPLPLVEDLVAEWIRGVGD